MNLQEFAALKAGDKITSMFGAAGTITEANDRGVRVCWGEIHANNVTFFFGVNSTAWMHWSKDGDT